MKKGFSINKQKELIEQLQSLWLKSEDDDDSIALSIFEIENLINYTSPENAMWSVVQEARRYLRRETDLISIIEPNRLLITSISSFIKHTHHQIRIHEMLKQPSLLNKSGRMEAIKISAGFAMFNYEDQKQKGIFDLYNLANAHLIDALKEGNAIKTQNGIELPKFADIPELDSSTTEEQKLPQQEDRRRSILPWRKAAERA
jgi:hypothetical protein